MSADLDGGAAPASLDELTVVDSLPEPSQDGGAAPHDTADTADTADSAVAEAPAAEADDAGPAPEPED